MIDYTIVHKDTNAITAHVLDNGDVEVRMPFDAPDQYADNVINKYLSGIKEQVYMRHQAIKTKKSINYKFQPLLLGERYPIIKNQNEVCCFDLKDECFYFAPGLRQYQLKRGLRNIYTEIAKMIFIPRMQKLSDKMGVKYDRFQISQEAQPFGHCVEGGELIEVSWTLAMTDEEFWESVLIHELAHIKYNNHYSDEYMELVKRFCPNYGEIQKRKTDYEIMLRADEWIAPINNNRKG